MTTGDTGPDTETATTEYVLTVTSSRTETATTHTYDSLQTLEASLADDFGLDRFQISQLTLSRGAASTQTRDFNLAGTGIPIPAQLGDRRMSFEMQPRGLNGEEINHGWSYWNTSTLEAARASALARVNAPGIGSIHIEGREMELGPKAWSPVLGGRHHSEVVERTEPVQLSAADMDVRCYESAVGGVAPSHGRRSDGSCCCGVVPSRFAVGNTPYRAGGA